MRDKPSYPARLAGWEYQYERAEKAEALAASRLELLRKVMEEYHKGIQSPLEFSEWLRAMDRVYGWELAEKLDDK